MKVLIYITFFFVSIMVQAQSSNLERIDPPFWWIGMNDPNLQLMLYGDNISDQKVQLQHSGITVEKIHRVENPNYLFIDLKIDSTALPGNIKIQINDTFINYQLKLREQQLGRNQGVSSKDLIYLIMPDRFANGDYSNDVIEELNEVSINRDSIFYRHGGDIQGIIDHLDYLSDLGVTSIWCTPGIENNQPVTSYHGYSATDHYKIDPRLGTNGLYKEFVSQCHHKGIKVIKDFVHNHVGNEHWILKDLPMDNWLNNWGKYTVTTYNCEPVLDPYASEMDRKRTVDGWIYKAMPDLNQKNEFVQNYLTQNSIWWLEYTGIDAIRLDTYFYNDPDYMVDWATKLKSEFPHVTLFAETWVKGITSQAYFDGGNTCNRGVESKIDGITDFQLRESLIDMVNKEPTEWINKLTPNISMNPVYATLARDFIYEDPSNNIAFLDNHDLSRIFSVIREDISKLKAALAVLLTTNRIPQLYYGTEIGLNGFCNPDGHVRKDFPGGWKEDVVNKFEASGRSDDENSIYSYVKKLANYRKKTSALQDGKLMQYFPDNNTYVYFRYDELHTIMVVVNSNDQEIELNAYDYSERVAGFKKAKDIITDYESNDLTNIHVPSKTTVVLELVN